MGTDPGNRRLNGGDGGAVSERRKPYETPRLVAYGDLRRLTAGDMSIMMNDGGGGGPDSKL